MAGFERPITELMTRPVVGVSAFSHVDSVLALANEKRAHHFPVFDGSQIVGLVCTCDLEEAPLPAAVGSVMRKPVVGVDVSMSVEQAARVMEEELVGSVLVMDGEDLRGIVTRRDLERAGWNLATPTSSCTACGGHDHLRSCPDGATLCSDCCVRARDHEWFDLGGGG